MTKPKQSSPAHTEQLPQIVHEDGKVIHLGHRGVTETRNLIAFTSTLGKCVVGHPGIANAFKKRDYAALGPFFLSLAQNKELLESGAKAFDGIKEIPAEIKGIDFLNGADIAGEALQGVKDVYSAYAATQLGEDGHGNEMKAIEAKPVEAVKITKHATETAHKK